MDVYLECLPCVLRQTLEASRMSTDNEDLQSKIMTEAVSGLSDYKMYRNSPEVCRAMHSIVKSRTGVGDPYKAIKQRDIQTALKLYPMLKRFINGQNDRLYWALKIAATGNVLDSSLNSNINIEAITEEEINKRFSLCDIGILKQRLKEAKRLLIIGDNAGETVFDRILLEELPSLDITYAVRSAPILNDATVEDAYASGLDKCARVIKSGCDIPGTNLDECSQEFLDIFYSTDVVISKGQGNYETLSDCGRDMFFLLKAKCPVLSRLLGVSLNDYVLTSQDMKRIDQEEAAEVK